MSDPEVRRLICEGDCNPDIRDIDAQVAHQRSRERGLSLRRMFPIHETVARRIRHLTYTPHERKDASTYVCTVCHHARKWGA